jgi:hypothetical protein
MRAWRAIPVGSGGTFLLPLLVGLPAATAIMLTGDTIDSAAIERIGLATKVVDDDELDGAARDFAATLASGPTKALGIMKYEMRSNLRNELDRALALELSLLDAPVEDRAEGALSFTEGARWFHRSLSAVAELAEPDAHLAGTTVAGRRRARRAVAAWWCAPLGANVTDPAAWGTGTFQRRTANCSIVDLAGGRRCRGHRRVLGRSAGTGGSPSATLRSGRRSLAVDGAVAPAASRRSRAACGRAKPSASPRCRWSPSRPPSPARRQRCPPSRCCSATTGLAR